MSSIKLYSGDGLTKVEDSAKPLIEGVLWERDVTMMLGTEKAGKSILAQQMAFALSSGSEFLDKFRVPEACGILYLQTEGKNAEMARRIECMERGLPLNRAFYFRAYKKFLPLDVPEFKEELVALLSSLKPRPKVMFIDSLYTSCVGDLTSNKDMRLFLAEVSYLCDAFSLAAVIIHHETKEGFVPSEGGKLVKVNQGDKRSYGSVFLRAFVENILYLSSSGRKRDALREFRCDTTRTGQTFEREELVLIQPDPLFFEIKEDYEALKQSILSVLNLKGHLSFEELRDVVKGEDGLLKKALRSMAIEGGVKVDGDWGCCLVN